MPVKTIKYSETGYFSKLMCDYLAQKDTLKQFYGNFPELNNFESQIELKKKYFNKDTRSILVDRLQSQYDGLESSEATQYNIESLGNVNTFTVTTGHQLNLFTGPLYFLYKIFSVINLSEALNRKHTDFHFVPVYWMATEDHDFEEINYFNFDGKKVTWDRPDGGAVGEFDTNGLQEVLEAVNGQWGTSLHAKQLSQWFEEAYTKHSNLADATRYLGNQIFKEYGLVIVDGNDAALKKVFIPYAKKELLENLAHTKVTETTTRLIEEGYNEQVHPREINLFYLTKGLRERIVEQEGTYFVNDTDIAFSKHEILKELETHPERFSPNALLRPLFQEVILPNLCYTGGGGELAYWFQLKDYFESVEVPFPILLLRNSVLLAGKKQIEKIERLDVTIDDLFKKQQDLITDFTHKISDIEIDFSSQRTMLQEHFKSMYVLAEKTDASFLGAVGAQEKKQLKGLDHLEKRLLKAQKRKLAGQLERLTTLQDNLFPKQSLQERNTNFSQFYLEYGNDLFVQLKNELDPLAHEFTIVEM